MKKGTTGYKKIKAPILGSVFVSIVLILAVVITGNYLWQTNQYEQKFENNLDAVQSLLQSELDEDARMMAGFLDLIKSDHNLQDLWLRRNKELLYEYCQPIFENICEKCYVTHFNFIDTEKVCFLRVHNPARFGDTIPRYTLAGAIESGSSSYGIEPGEFGIFTLRTVHPWKINNKLAGYVELGMEIEHISSKISEITGLSSFFAIYKKYLNRENWEDGLEIIGRSGDWDMFPDFAIVDHTSKDIPAKLINKYYQNSSTEKSNIFNKLAIGKDQLVGSIPLFDAGNRRVGEIITVKDITTSIVELHRTTIILSVIALAIGGLLLIFSNIFLGRIESKLNSAKKLLYEEIENRKQIEGELQKQADFFNNYPAPVLQADYDGTISRYNSAAAKLIGKNLFGESIGSIFPEVTKFDTNELSDREIIQIEQSINDKVFLFTILRNDKARSWFVYGIDITERKKFDTTLKVSESKYRTLFEASTDGILITDIEKKTIRFANPSFCNALGYEATEIIGQCLARFHREEDLNYIMLMFESHARGDLDVIENIPFLRKNGDIIYLDVSSSTAEIDGTLCSIDFFRDVTERWKSEQKIRKMSNEWEKTFNSTNDLVSIHDKDCNIIRVNNAFADILGMAPEDLIGQKCFKIVHQTESPWPTCPLKKAAIDKKSAVVEYLEPKLERFLEVSASPIIDENGEVTGIVHIAKDITARKELEQQLRTYSEWIELKKKELNTALKKSTEANENLEQSEKQLKNTVVDLEASSMAADSANQAKSDFLINMSHEIRTPMNAIIGMTNLLFDTELTDEQSEMVSAVKTSGDSLLNIINDILDFSKIEDGKLSIEPISFDLQTMIEDTADLIAPRTAEKGLELIIRLEPGTDRRVIGDPGRIRQIIANFAGNSVKFTHEGYILIGVEKIGLSDDSISLKIAVTDTGIGIAKDKLEHMFDKFTRADTSTTRKYGGTGLGLSISRKLVELMNGKIEVKSKLNEGSTFAFEITLPLDTETVPSQLPEADLDDVRILLVDDNQINRNVMAEYFEGWGIDYELSSSGDEALMILREANKSGNYHQIVIIDYNMPDMNGEELARKITCDPALADIQLILFTSCGRPGDAIQMKKAGFAAYLTKPVKHSQLLKAISAVWSAHKHGLNLGLITRHSLAETDVRTKPAELNENYSISKALERLDGDVELLRELIKIFLAKYPAMMIKIQEAIADKNSKALQKSVHKIKDLLANFEAARAIKLALTLENRGQEQNFEQIEKDLSRFKDELDRVIDEFGKFTKAIEV